MADTPCGGDCVGQTLMMPIWSWMSTTMWVYEGDIVKFDIWQIKVRVRLEIET